MSEKESKVNEKSDKKNVQLNFRVSKTMKEQIKELAEEMNISEAQVLENAFQLYYAQDVMPENIILGRMTQLQQEITTMNRKIETLAGIFYFTMPYILGVLPSLPKWEKDENGNVFNPALQKGQHSFEGIIKSYKKDMRTYKISFMQNVWADMQETLNMTHLDAVGMESNDRSSGN